MTKKNESRQKTVSTNTIEPSVWYFPLLLILLSPCFLRMIVAKSPADTIALGVQLVVLGALLYAFSWRRTLAVVLAVSAVFAMIDALYYLEYRESVSVRAIAIALQTPLEQSVSFISARLWTLLIAMFSCALVCIQICRAPSPTTRSGLGSKIVRWIAMSLTFIFVGLAIFAFSIMAGASALIAGKFTVLLPPT
jgi:hypothetical protein